MRAFTGVLVARALCLTGCRDGSTLWSIALTGRRVYDGRFGDFDPKMVFGRIDAVCFRRRTGATLGMQRMSMTKIKSRYRLSSIRQGIFQFLLLL